MKHFISKRFFLFLILSTIGSYFLVSCVKYGEDKKKVKLSNYQLIGDGNNDDSTFFYFSITNENSHELKDPYLRMVAKDTSDKILFSTLFRETEELPNIPANSTYSHSIYTEKFEINDEVGKIKVKLEWTNSKNKNSFIRKVYYF